MTSNRVQTVRRAKAAVVGLGTFAALGSAIAIGAATHTGPTSDSANQDQSPRGSQRVHVVRLTGANDAKGDDGEGRAAGTQQVQQVQQAPPVGGLQQGQAASAGSSHTTSSGS